MPAVIPELHDHFIMFARNDRWGTCADCPHDSSGMKYPEFCTNTDRYDHRLTMKDLYETYYAYMR